MFNREKVTKNCKKWELLKFTGFGTDRKGEHSYKSTKKRFRPSNLKNLVLNV